jgi:hypothetical protein
LTNTGNANLTPIVVGSPTGQFSVVNGCPASLGFAPGSNSCTITVTFTRPVNNVGGSQGSLTITDNATPGTQTVTLSGTVLAPSIRGTLATPAPATWTAQQLNATKVFTLTPNAGNTAPLQITGAPTAASQGNRFTITGTTCTANLQLAAGASCTVTVRYVNRGTRNQQRNPGTLTVPTNTTAQQAISAQLDGN